jgi:hypothetical protein
MLLLNLDNNFACMFPRKEIIESLFRLAELEHSIKCGIESDLLFFKETVHLFKICLGAHSNASAEYSLAEVSSTSPHWIYPNLLDLCRLYHQIHEPCWLPVRFETIEKTYECNSAASSA